VLFINPADIFCGQEECYAVKDGNTYYRDRDHLSLFAARQIVDEIKQQRQ
jgi:hypothetical protein